MSLLLLQSWEDRDIFQFVLGICSWSHLSSPWIVILKFYWEVEPGREVFSPNKQTNKQNTQLP